MYFEHFKSNHDTVSIGLSLKCDDENCMDGLRENFFVTKVDLFFEVGTDQEKIDKYKQMAKLRGLEIKGCFIDVSSEEIKTMIQYVIDGEGILLNSR